MLVDGKRIAGELAAILKEEVANLLQTPVLLVIQVDDDPASVSFIKAKRAFAERVGVELRLVQFPRQVGNDELSTFIKEMNIDPRISGIIVQLPLPISLDTESVLSSITPHKDPDLLSLLSRELFRSGKSNVLPPVVAAINEIFKYHNINLSDKKILVVGDGRLVGRPVSTWLSNEKVEHTLVNRDTPDISKLMINADLIITGAGHPGLIKVEDVKEGVIIIDAGTSEESGKPGKLAGDADERCAEKAELFTPVPGGVGPVAVAMLFRNLIELIRTAR